MSDLKSAYSVDGPKDCAKLYARWADSYDSGFVKENDYCLPVHVAAAFLAAGGTGPVLDVGAGTGLLGQNLRQMGYDGEIDGVDISPEMLARAKEKDVYTNLSVADVTVPLNLFRPPSGVVSSGTFTLGHVGPDALFNIEKAAAKNALIAISINATVFEKDGFARALAARPGVELHKVNIYGPANRDHHHSNDVAIIATWRNGP